MRNLFKILSLALLLVACQKDLDIVYRPVPPAYVVEGSISDSPARVHITQTRSMSDSIRPHGVEVAEVRLSDDNGREETLVYGADGYYHSPSDWVGETGRTYTLNVHIDGQTYSAKSTMMPAASLDSIRFLWLESAGMKMMILKCFNTLPEGQLNYTHSTVTRNGRFYRSHTFKQINPDYLQAEALIGCTTEKKMEEDKPDDQDAILHEGDRIHVELWTIDRPVFDYLFSLRTGRQNASNPLYNFSGNLLGYFSAHHTCAIDTIFHFSDVKPY